LPLQQDFYSKSHHASPQNSSQIYAYGPGVRVSLEKRLWLWLWAKTWTPGHSDSTLHYITLENYL